MALIMFDYDGVLADTLNDLFFFGLEACNKLDIKHVENQKQESVFTVGDALSIALAAKEASVTGIAVNWGHQTLEILLCGNPDYMVSIPHHLIEIVEQLCEETIFYADAAVPFVIPR